MTFLQLYGEKLSIELASSDTTILFTTARRKAAVNEAQDAFARMTGCTKRYGSIAVVDGTAEYDLETITDYIRLAGAPSIKIVGTSDTRYIQGPDDFPRRDVEELDRTDPSWRAASDGTPSAWYIKEDGGATYFGLNPAPDVTVGDTWTIIVPYVADPADMSLDAAVPFTFSSNSLLRLVPYHQALAHYAAGLLEPLRKNYTGVTRQMQIYSGYVAQYLQQQREDGRDQLIDIRDYFGESHRGSRPRDARSWP